MKKLCFILLLIITLNSCQRPLYKFKSYDQSAFKYSTATDDKDIKKVIKGYKSFVENPKKSSKPSKNTKKLAPGICADYAYLLLLQGDTVKANTFFDKEIHLYPESQTYINNLKKQLGL